MKIVYHHRTQGGGAEGVHIREVVKALRQLGHQVKLISPPNVDPFKISANPKAPKNKSSGLKKKIVLALPQVCFEILELGYNVWAYLRLNSVVKKIQPDFIYERYAFFCWAGVKIAKKFHVPIILEVNEISGIKRQRPQKMVGLCRRIEEKIFSEADALIVVSDLKSLTI